MAVAERILNLKPLADLRTDKLLVRAAQSGQTQAASALIARHYPRVYSFVSYLTNAANADDLTQEVFARALGALGRFNGQYQFEPWLLRIAKNLVIDEARRDSHRAQPTDPSDLPEMEEVREDSDDAWRSVSQKMASSVVKQALERLPLRQRTVLVLREIEGLPYADIAQIVGTNVRGAEATLRRARERFRLEAAEVENNLGTSAVCKRTLRLVATESELDTAALRHLQGCKQCRMRSTSIRNADKLFGALPPVFLGAIHWNRDVLSHLPAAPARRGILEVLRGQAGYASSTIAQSLQAAASLAVAGAISISSLGSANPAPAISKTAAASAVAITSGFGAPASSADVVAATNVATAASPNGQRVLSAANGTSMGAGGQQAPAPRDEDRRLLVLRSNLPEAMKQEILADIAAGLDVTGEIIQIIPSAAEALTKDLTTVSNITAAKTIGAVTGATDAAVPVPLPIQKTPVAPELGSVTPTALPRRRFS